MFESSTTVERYGRCFRLDEPGEVEKFGPSLLASLRKAKENGFSFRDIEILHVDEDKDIDGLTLSAYLGYKATFSKRIKEADYAKQETDK